MNPQSRRLMDREEVVVENGVVATKHPLESEAGIEILEAGGNAIDAAVAIGFLATVVEPAMVTLGGVGMMQYHEAASGRTWTVDFLARAPTAATPEMYPWREAPGNHLSTYQVEGSRNVIGHRSIAVPSLVRGLCEAHRRWGRLPLAVLLEPAIARAEAGIVAEPYILWHINWAIGEGMRRFPATAAIYLEEGIAPPAGSLIRQRDLASTLRLIAERGPDAFYTGDVAAAIEREVRGNGGILSRDDLSACIAEVRPSLAATYRGHEIRFSDCPNGLWTGMQTLNILERFDLSRAGHNTPEALHAYIEAARHAFADRYYYLGDPDFEPVPLEGVLSKEYARTLARLIDPARSGHDEASPPPAVRFALESLHDPWPFDRSGRAPKRFQAAGAGPLASHTTSYAIADRERNLVVCTETTGEVFGSKVTIPGTGIVMNDMMALFSPRPGTANSIAPWKRTLGSTTAPVVLREGRPFLAAGAPGGRRIMNAIQQVLVNVIDHGMSIQPAISAPRVDCSTGVTTYDDRIDDATIARLTALGHRMVPVRMELDPFSWDFAQPTGVMVDDDGHLRGGVDPFVRAEALGF